MDRESSDIVRMIRDARSARQGVLGRLRSQAVPAKGKAAAAKRIQMSQMPELWRWLRRRNVPRLTVAQRVPIADGQLPVSASFSLSPSLLDLFPLPL